MTEPKDLTFSRSEKMNLEQVVYQQGKKRKDEFLDYKVYAPVRFGGRVPHGETHGDTGYSSYKGIANQLT